MPGKILREIQQSRPFSTLEEEAFLNIQRTADLLQQEIVALLKPHGLSPVQYNVLRILRGAGEKGTHCKAVGERMITPDPDVTRLVDRLEKRGLVTRSRGTGDRRFVNVSISSEGLNVLASLDEPVEQTNLRLLGHLTPEKLTTLITLLEDSRERLKGNGESFSDVPASETSETPVDNN